MASHNPIKGNYVPERFQPLSVVTLEVAGEDIDVLTEQLKEDSYGPVLVSGGVAPDPSSCNDQRWFSWVLVSPGASTGTLCVTAIDDDRLNARAADGQPLWKEILGPIPGVVEEQRRRIEELRKQREAPGPTRSSASASSGPTHERVWRHVGTVVGRVPTPKVIAAHFDLAERHVTRRGMDGPYRRLDPQAPHPKPKFWHDAWIRDDDQSLVIYASGGRHEEPHSIVVDHSVDHVTVTLMVGDSGHVGPSPAHIWWFEVRLPEPLHGRFLRDGEEAVGS